MASNKPEYWGFQSLAGLLRDLGPTEGQRKVYKRFKELYQIAETLSAGEPPDEWTHLDRTTGHGKDISTPQTTNSRVWPHPV